ncbi:40S ribosomal protein S21-2 [Morus notabilis]|uniref:40S ribosomal protein S21-2 n=1 Tax=Morus notabilis TaxID=981085 RepID=W9RV16_9ROSA|nr:40S ribosomal protein S21-2 [Morus notabilis]
MFGSIEEYAKPANRDKEVHEIEENGVNFVERGKRSGGRIRMNGFSGDFQQLLSLPISTKGATVMEVKGRSATSIWSPHQHGFQVASRSRGKSHAPVQFWPIWPLSATNRLITSKDHASVQINAGHLDENGIYTGQFSTFALCGFVRAQVHFLSPIFVFCLSFSCF